MKRVLFQMFYATKPFKCTLSDLFYFFSITAEPLKYKKIYISAILLYKWQVQSHIIFFFSLFFLCVCTESLKHIRLLRDLKNNV